MLQNYKNIIHLSHIDQDGFGCQFLVSKVTEVLDINYIPINGDYKEIDSVIENLLDTIRDIRERSLILITDLNLSKDSLDKLKYLENDNLDILILDHHELYKDVNIVDYPFYIQNRDYSATMLTYNWLLEHLEGSQQELLLNYNGIVNAIDNADTFKEVNRYDFRFGRYFAKNVMKFHNTYPNYLEIKRVVIFKLLELATLKLDSFNSNLNSGLSIDEALYNIDIEFNRDMVKLLTNTLKPLDDILVELIKDELLERPEFILENSSGKKFLITVGLSAISDISKSIFEESDIDVILGFSSGDGLSIRVSPDSDIDGAKLARAISKDGKGGGHKKASGCYYPLNDDMAIITGQLSKEEVTYIKDVIDRF